MTNYEYHYKDFIKVVASSLGFKNGIPVACQDIECNECDLYEMACQDAALSWLLQEHNLKPKITRQEFEFLCALNPGYIARDMDGELYWYIFKPVKGAYCWIRNGVITRLEHQAFNTEFSFITWDDPEPWSVEDLRKLEVIE